MKTKLGITLAGLIILSGCYPPVYNGFNLYDYRQGPMMGYYGYCRATICTKTCNGVICRTCTPCDNFHECIDVVDKLSCQDMVKA